MFFLIILILAVWLGEKQRENSLSRYTATFFDIFDTRTDIIGYSTSQEKFTEQVTLVKEKLEYYHKLYDIYNNYNEIVNIKTINDNAGKQPVTVGKEIFELLLFSKEMYAQTNGQINIAMGSVLKIWHAYRQNGINNPKQAALPSMQELQEAYEFCDINQMILDEELMTVYLPDEKMSIDVGGIGKGYAVQKTAEYAKEIGIEHMLLSVGGNVCAVGTKLDGSSWKIGIQNPNLHSEEAYVKKVDVEDSCVVTSGNYQRYYIVDGIAYCHIIDEDTLMPANYFSSVSIISNDSGKADALSTAIFNMPFEEGLAFVNKLEDVEAMWILKDESIKYSDGFEKYLAE